MKLHKIMRDIHLYTGLFLWPWLLVYATSGFIFNHNAAFNKLFGQLKPNPQIVRETSFRPPADFPQEPSAQAQAILRYLDMDGPFHLDRRSNENRLMILRVSGGGNFRVTWTRASSQVTVQRMQPFSMRRLVHFLHFRHGYHQSYAAPILWAIIVDSVCISLWLWVISGLYLWWKMPRLRVIGGICLGSALFVFAILVYMLCQ